MGDELRDSEQRRKVIHEQKSLDGDSSTQLSAAQRQPPLIQKAPMSRRRSRADGGLDYTTRVNFVGSISPGEMRHMTQLLVNLLEEGEPLGLIALTKIEFIEPDTCEYRYWWRPPTSAEVFGHDLIAFQYGAWSRLNMIHKIHNVDGVVYWWLRDQSVHTDDAAT